MAIAMATDSSPDSSLSRDSSESSGEGSLELSYESSSFGSGEESEPEGVHPYLYEPTISSDSEDGGSADSDSSVDVSPRLLNLNWYRPCIAS